MTSRQGVSGHGRGGTAPAGGAPKHKGLRRARPLTVPGLVCVLAAAALVGGSDASAATDARAADRTPVSAAGQDTWQQTPVQMPWGNLVAVGGDGTPGNTWATGFSLTDDGQATFGAAALRWDGATWIRTPVPVRAAGDVRTFGSRLDSRVAEIAPDDVWAVGDIETDAPGSGTQPLIEHWNGAAWQQTPADVLPAGSEFYGLCALSADDVWAGGLIGDEPGLAHWDGRTWTAVTPRALTGLPSPSYVTSLSASGPGDIWAVGADGLSAHYDGHTWKKVPLPAIGDDEIWLEGVRTDPALGTWAVGYRVGADGVRHPLALHAVSGAWRQVALPDATRTQLEDVAFTSTGPVAFGYVDSSTTVAAYAVTLPTAPGGSGRLVAAPTGASSINGALAGPGGRTVLVVGSGPFGESIFPPFAARSTSRP
ncbi:hypothetical protein ABZ901_10785 [Actinacidiphila alni]|uniref:hypothetical protein n=1 Tax=Actinacidiphila alni TaxID=380248 RepID=UPI003403050A